MYLISIIRASEARATSLESSLATSATEHPDIKKHKLAEAEAKQHLEGVSRELEQYKSVYGNSSSSSPNLHEMTEQLRKKQAEVERFRLLDQGREEVRFAPRAPSEMLTE